MSFPQSSSAWGEPASSRSLGWKSSATRPAATSGGTIAPAEKWAKLRHSVPLPLSRQEAPSLSFSTPEAAAIAIQQFQQGEEEGRLAAQLEALASASRAIRSAVDSNSQFFRSQAGVAEKRKIALGNEIAQVRRAVHATDARKDIIKECHKTVITVRDILRSFVVAQDKLHKGAVAEMDKTIAAPFSDMKMYFGEALSEIEQNIGFLDESMKRIESLLGLQDERMKRIESLLGLQDERMKRIESIFHSVASVIGSREGEECRSKVYKKRTKEMTRVIETSSSNSTAFVPPRKKIINNQIESRFNKPCTKKHAPLLSSSGALVQNSDSEQSREKKINLVKQRMKTKATKFQLRSNESRQVEIEESCTLTEEPLVYTQVDSRKEEDSLFTLVRDATTVEPISALFDVSDRDEDDFVIECGGHNVPRSNQQQSSEFWSIGARLKSRSRKRA